jgi:hypothetical protein
MGEEARASANVNDRMRVVATKFVCVRRRLTQEKNKGTPAPLMSPRIYNKGTPAPLMSPRIYNKGTPAPLVSPRIYNKGTPAPLFRATILTYHFAILLNEHEHVQKRPRIPPQATSIPVFAQNPGS